MHTLHQWGKTYAIIFSPFLPFDHISPQKLVWPYPPPPLPGGQTEIYNPEAFH